MPVVFDRVVVSKQDHGSSHPTKMLRTLAGTLYPVTAHCIVCCGMCCYNFRGMSAIVKMIDYNRADKPVNKSRICMSIDKKRGS
jgi:hypothetical protein